MNIINDGPCFIDIIISTINDTYGIRILFYHIVSWMINECVFICKYSNQWYVKMCIQVKKNLFL